MTLDAVIAVAALLLAAYQIMSPPQRLDLSLRFGWIEKSGAVGAILAIIYLQFYSVFKAVGLTPGFAFYRWNLTPEKGSFVVLLLASAWLYWRLRHRKLPPGQIFKFQKLIEDLISQRQIPNLLILVKRHVGILVKIKNKDVGVAKFRRDNLSQEPPPEVVINYSDGSWQKQPLIHVSSPIKDNPDKVYEFIAKRLPNTDDRSASAAFILNKIFTSPEILKGIVELRAYDALDAFNYDIDDKLQFAHGYWRALLHDSSSILYSEVSNNGYVRGITYIIPETNKILHYFLKDAKIIQSYELWHPIGIAALDELSHLAEHPHQDTFKRPASIHSLLPTKSAFHMSLFLFDVIVRQALQQNLEHNMGMHYVTYINQAIIKNCAGSRSTPISITSPSAYEHTIKIIFVKLSEWVIDAAEVPRDHPNVELKSITSEIEDGNIPKNSLIALGYCLRDVLTSPNIDEGFKANIVAFVFNFFFKLVEIDRLGYAEVLVNVLRSHCQNDYFRSRFMDMIDANKHEFSSSGNDIIGLGARILGISSDLSTSSS